MKGVLNFFRKVARAVERRYYLRLYRKIYMDMIREYPSGIPLAQVGNRFYYLTGKHLEDYAPWLRQLLEKQGPVPYQ